MCKEYYVALLAGVFNTHFAMKIPIFVPHKFINIVD